MQVPLTVSSFPYSRHRAGHCETGVYMRTWACAGRETLSSKAVVLVCDITGPFFLHPGSLECSKLNRGIKRWVDLGHCSSHCHEVELVVVDSDCRGFPMWGCFIYGSHHLDPVSPRMAAASHMKLFKLKLRTIRNQFLFTPTKFQALSSHMWLVATTWDGTELEHDLHHKVLLAQVYVNHVL